MLHSSQQQPDYHVEQHSITEKDKLAAAKQKVNRWWFDFYNKYLKLIKKIL